MPSGRTNLLKTSPVAARRLYPLEQRARQKGSNYDRIAIVGCPSAMHLATGVSRNLKVPLISAEIGKSPCGSPDVKINADLENHWVFLIGNANQGIDVLNREISELESTVLQLGLMGPKRVIVTNPCFHYARQDRIGEEREPLSASDMAAFLDTLAPTLAFGEHQDRVRIYQGRRIIGTFNTVDLHNPAIVGFFRTMPVNNLTLSKYFIRDIRRRFRKKLDEVKLTPPDLGRSKMVESYAKAIWGSAYAEHLVQASKSRSGHNVVGDAALIGDVAGKIVVVIDDIIDTAGTIEAIVYVLKQSGAKEVHVMATHPIFSGQAPEKMNRILNEDQVIDSLTISDTMQLRPEHQVEGMRIRSAVPLLSSVIERIYLGKSLSSAGLVYKG
ncbi:MAG: ribose-phosphate diphosphokinase [Candidatus Margulisbacteria bacterium]|nr:ribose-phosphate diphosphokinase [Candidatus Margulisiibacteriota bacterium]MBU1021690.1 ribose-phosphate diphosphokinase [Candidatus Margulisiibacteriota bacterium]MBU1729568.1 ribose-phosphate diphosphokinase [Candidatus Margulisiibacteriota bacterium]MBU1955054.1 ribose-phosphate diphosphokinase [Candidatus Margulisiibacteriota bacterium]